MRSIRFSTALLSGISGFLFIFYSTVTQAIVTYGGTNGVRAQIFASNPSEPCLSCHHSALVGSDRNSAPTGVNFDTYAWVVAPLYNDPDSLPTTNASRAVFMINNNFMPYVLPDFDLVPLSSTLKTLITNWESVGFPQSSAPTNVTTGAGVTVTKTSADVSGSAVPNCDATTGSFQYAVSPATPSSVTGGFNLGAICNNSTTGVAFSGSITGLTCGTQYNYRARAANASGTTNGTTRSFTTAACNVPEIDQGAAVTVDMSVNGAPNAFALQLSASGDVGDTFSWAISVQPPAGGGTAGVPSGTTTNSQLKTINYTPPADTAGSFAFTVRVTGNSGSATTVVTVNVGLAVPVISQGVQIARSTLQNMPIDIMLTAADSDSAALIWSVSSPASRGTVDVPAGATASGETKTVTYMPDPGINEQVADTFVIQVADESGHADTIDITVHVLPPDVLAGYVQFTVPHITGLAGSYIPVSTGLFAVVAELTVPPVDPDALTYDWSGSSPELLDAVTNTGSNFIIFDSSVLLPGHYWADLVVSQGSASIHNRVTLTILGNVPATDDAFDCNGDDVVDNSDSVDCDGDGILNLADGVLDQDYDGIQDYLDDLDEPADSDMLQNQTGDPANAKLLLTEPGLKLRLGEIARFANRRGPLISMEDIASFGGANGTPVSNAADSMFNVGGIYNFEIAGLENPGDSARVVIPLLTNIPAAAEYRKYTPARGWYTFADVASARAVSGLCPAPGSSAYRSGLSVFDNCVQLTLVDGGQDDADGEANGLISDPGGVAVNDPSPGPAEPPAPDDGGGGLLHPLWLLLLLAWGIVRFYVALRKAEGRA